MRRTTEMALDPNAAGKFDTKDPSCNDHSEDSDEDFEVTLKQESTEGHENKSEAMKENPEHSYQKLRMEHRKLETIVTSQSIEIEKLKDENNKYVADVELLTASCQNLSILNKVREEEFKKLKAAFTILRADVEKLSTATETKGKIIDRLQSKISTLEKSTTKESNKEAQALSVAELQKLQNFITTKDEIITTTQKQLMDANKLTENLKGELLAFHTNPHMTTVDDFCKPGNAKKNEAKPWSDTSPTPQKVKPEPEPGKPESNGVPKLTTEKSPFDFDLDVLVVGDSNVSGLIPEKIYRKQRIRVETLPDGKKNISGALEYFRKCQKNPKVIVLHVAANSLTNASAEDCVTRMHDLLKFCMDKFPNAKIIHSEIFPRLLRTEAGTKKYYYEMVRYNKLMREIIKDNSFMIRHKYLNDPWTHHFQNDGLHLSEIGIKTFVKSMKIVVNPHLGLTTYTHYGEAINLNLKQRTNETGSSNYHSASQPRKTFVNQGHTSDDKQNYLTFVTEFKNLRNKFFKR